MEYEDYSVQQYITVFWDFNKKKNNFIDEMKSHIQKILSININDVDDNQKCEVCMRIIHDYELFVSKIKGLRSCLDELLQQNVFNKLEKYNDDFIIRCARIFDELEKKTEIKLTASKFKDFMYNNTPEGRVIMQNMNAIEFLKDVKIAETCVKNIKTRFIKLKSVSQKDTTLNVDYVSDVDSEENYPELVEINDNESTGSLSD